MLYTALFVAIECHFIELFHDPMLFSSFIHCAFKVNKLVVRSDEGLE